MSKIANRIKYGWQKFWMRFAGLSNFGRLATRLASWFAPPYKSRAKLARLNAKGYIAPSATIHHPNLIMKRGAFVGENSTIFRSGDGGDVCLEQNVKLYGDVIIETGEGGQVYIDEDTHIQPRCQFSAYKGSIKIGKRAEIAPNCAFYPYNHQMNPEVPIREQPLVSKGDIVIGDDVWLGYGVVVLENVHIGDGAVIGASSLVTKDVPANSVAMGVPAKIIRVR